ncbi:MAG: DUF2213 domain-containing protein [Enterobacteriaceae bacterium]|jgi:hypothetical protein|nr:DUF2213 domain-containing protein [Enterobacteriaceae bacterium]
MTKRKYDGNGWLEVKDNPITKVGVFPYLGSEIGAPERDKIYMVYRPAEELEKPETINSFKLLPFTDEHEMLGKDGTPAEKKGIQGVIGEQVYFDAPYLRGNIKVLSNSALSLIDSGKIELSPGYTSRYEFTSGSFDGKHYDAIQRDLRGNHLALVDEGRTGPDVAVQDHIITIDTLELLKMAEEDKDKEKKTQDEGGFTSEQAEQLNAMITAAIAKAKETQDEDPENVDQPNKETSDDSEDVEETVEAAVEAAEVAVEAAESGEPAAVEEAETAIEAAETAVEEAKEELEQATTDSMNRRLKRLRKSVNTADSMAALKRKVSRLEKNKPTLDTGELLKQIAGRDELANRLSGFVGTFDSAAMTHQQVAEYGVEKLGIKCPKGSEAVAVDVWLQGRKPDAEKTSVTMDSVPAQSIKDKWSKK